MEEYQTSKKDKKKNIDIKNYYQIIWYYEFLIWSDEIVSIAKWK